MTTTLNGTVKSKCKEFTRINMGQQTRQQRPKLSVFLDIHPPLNSAPPHTRQ